MNTSSLGDHHPDGALDAWDIAILDEVRAAYTALDPVPHDLVDRIQFALALEDIDLEVLHLRSELDQPVGVRSEEISRTITFDSASLTIMIMLTPIGGQSTRIDGWLAPPAAHEIEVRTTAGPLIIHASEDGRFAAESIAAGLCQLVVRIVAHGHSRLVVTPSIVL